MIREIQNWFIRTFGLKGSWSWAKRQMMKGHMVRCSWWAGALKLKIDNPDNKLLMASFFREKNLIEGNPIPLWEPSVHHINYEDFTEFVIVKWDDESLNGF